MHVHTAVGEDVAQLILEDIQYRNPLFLLRIAFSEQSSDPKCAKNEEIALKRSCPSRFCGRIELGIETSLWCFVFRQFNYTKGLGSVPFYIACIIEFSRLYTPFRCEKF